MQIGGRAAEARVALQRRWTGGAWPSPGPVAAEIFPGAWGKNTPHPPCGHLLPQGEKAGRCLWVARRHKQAPDSPLPLRERVDAQQTGEGFLRMPTASPLHLPLRRPLPLLILIIKQRHALFGEVVADGVGLGEVLGVKGRKPFSNGGGDMGWCLPAVIGIDETVEAEAE